MAALVCFFAVALTLIRRQPGEWVTGLLICVLAAAGAVRSTPPPPIQSPAWVDEAAAIRGTVASQPTSTGRYQSFRLDVSEAEIDDEWHPASGTVCVTGQPLPRPGLADRVMVVGRSESLPDLPAAVRAYLRYRGCGASLFAQILAIDERGVGWERAFALRRDEVSLVLQRAAPGDAGALLSGLVTGDDHALTRGRVRAFRRTGTTHITAVSGANVALIVSILATVGVAGGLRRNLLWQIGVVGAIWAYAVLVGGEPPVVRAALVASVALIAVRFGRRPDFVTLIALAAVTMVLIDPTQIWSLSFQLSFAASLGIVVVMQGLSNEGALSGVSAAFRASIAAQISTLPVLWVVFGELSLTSLPANLLIAPLIGLAFPLAALAGAAGTLWQPLATVIALPARMCADLVFDVVDRLGGSDRALATVGESSPLEALLISGVAVTVILLMSADARRWFMRLQRRVNPAFSMTETAGSAESIVADRRYAKPAVDDGRFAREI